MILTKRQDENNCHNYAGSSQLFVGLGDKFWCSQFVFLIHTFTQSINYSEIVQHEKNTESLEMSSATFFPFVIQCNVLNGDRCLCLHNLYQAPFPPLKVRLGSKRWTDEYMCVSFESSRPLPFSSLNKKSREIFCVDSVPRDDRNTSVRKV